LLQIDDVNRDGKPDLLVANETAVGVLLGNGNGTFQAVARLNQAIYLAQSVVVADMNGDGKPDLVLADWCISSSNCDQGGVGILLGNGDGTFQEPVIYGSGGYQADSLAVADVNGDGKLDVVVGHTGNAKVGVLRGAGGGRLQPAVMFSAGGEVGSVAVADVNGDHKPDLLAATASGVAVLLNNMSFCTTSPVVTLSAFPRLLWPPNGKVVPVTVSGTITDASTGCNVRTAAYEVTDEYAEVQPSGTVTLGLGGTYTFTVWLEASRIGTDLDGRLYTVTVSASNNVGKTGSQAATIVVPHDQGH
jgi:hypothetical protein